MAGIEAIEKQPETRPAQFAFDRIEPRQQRQETERHGGDDAGGVIAGIDVERQRDQQAETEHGQRMPEAALVDG